MTMKKTPPNCKLLASSPTEEGITKMIADYYMGSTITLKETDTEGLFHIHNLNGKIPRVWVRIRKNRYRFEEVQL